MEDLLANVIFFSMLNGFDSAIRKTLNLKIFLAAVMDLYQFKCSLSCFFLWTDKQTYIVNVVYKEENDGGCTSPLMGFDAFLLSQQSETLMSQHYWEP